MRMWRPERAVHGPLPITDADLGALNRLFADSFTDRYRRDGLVGVRVPFLNEAIWRYAIQDAGAGAMLWRDEGGRMVAFNIAHVSGVEGWMGPLCVRPDRQLAGLGTEVVGSAMEWLKAQGARTIGLETMPRTVDNIGFYARLGFVPGHVTLTLGADTAPRGTARGRATLTALPSSARDAVLAEMRALVTRLAPGTDFTREVELTLALGLGDVVLHEQAGVLAAFALCHAAPLAEGGGRDEVRALKIVAADRPAFLDVLDAATVWGRHQGARRLAVRCQTSYHDVFAELMTLGYRVRWSDLRMHLAGYAEPQPATGVIWSNWEI